MQAEIKFRVWDKRYKKMYHPTTNLFVDWDKHYGSKLLCEIASSEGKRDLSDADYEIMQYASMRDKNKKEIYAGDIIELINADGEKIRVICEYGIARRYIMGAELMEVDIPGFYFKLPNGKKSFPMVNNYLGKHDLEIFEVIGNIYENPDLIPKT